MHKIISAQPEWETVLAPRILLGLWHTNFIPHAKVILPYCRRSYIGISLEVARKYFWDSCEVFSMHFAGLSTVDGERYARQTRRRGVSLLITIADLGRSVSRQASKSWYGP